MPKDDVEIVKVFCSKVDYVKPPYYTNPPYKKFENRIAFTNSEIAKAYGGKVRLEHYTNARLDDTREVDGKTWHVVKIEDDGTLYWGRSYSGKPEVCCPPLPPRDMTYGMKGREYLSGPIMEIHDDTADALAYAMHSLRPTWPQAKFNMYWVTNGGPGKDMTFDEMMEHK